MSTCVHKRSQKRQWWRKSELYFTLVGWKRPGFIQQLDIHKGGRQEKACHYFRTVRESIGTEDESSNSQTHTTRNATRTRWASGWFYLKIKKSSSKMSISRQCWSRRRSFGSAHLGVKKSRCPEVSHKLRQIIDAYSPNETARSYKATSKCMKTLAGSSESHQEGRSIDAIYKEQERESCNNCGKQHPRNKCPAYGTLCWKCGKANHWQSVCRSSKRRQLNQGRKLAFKKVIHTIEDRGDEENDEILTISTIKVNTTEDTQHSTHDTHDEVFATLEIIQPEKKRKINLQCKIDTGAQSNVLPIRLLRIINPEKFDDEGNPKPEALEKNEAVLLERKINCIFCITDT